MLLRAALCPALLHEDTRADFKALLIGITTTFVHAVCQQYVIDDLPLHASC